MVQKTLPRNCGRFRQGNLWQNTKEYTKYKLANNQLFLTLLCNPKIILGSSKFLKG